MFVTQAVDDVKEGRVQVTSRVASQLKMLVSQEKHDEVVVYHICCISVDIHE